MNNKNSWNTDLGWCTTNDGMACVLRKENVIFNPDTVVLKAMHHPDGICGVQYLEDGSVRTMAKYFSSGVIMSKEKFLYGTFEAYFKIPNYRGAWPSIWLYGESPEQGYDEIDIFEQFRKHKHYGKYKQQSGIIWKENNIYYQKVKECSLDTDMMIVNCFWTDRLIQIRINGELILEITGRRRVPQQPLYFIASHYIGNWKPETKTDDMIIYNMKHNGINLI